MAWGWDSYDNAMGGGLLGNLTEEEKRRLRMQSLGAFGAGLLDHSGWSPAPQTMGQGMAQGMANAQGAYQQGASDLTAYKDRQVQRDAALAKRQQEAEAKAELDRLMASGEQITPQTAMKIVALAPSLSNVVQQAMKMQGEGGKEKLPLSAIGKQVYDMGIQPGTPEWQSAYSQALTAARAPKGEGDKPRDQYRTLTAQEVAEAGFAKGTIVQANNMTGQLKVLSKPEAGKAGEGEAGGMNPRQQYASGQMHQQVVNYVASRLGITPDEAKKLTSAQVKERMLSSGRTFEGPILGRVPFTNSDLQPYVQSMASNQAMVNNPTGIVTESDLASAQRQVVNPQQPIEVQAELAAQAWDKYGSAPDTEPAVAAPMTDEEYAALPSGAVYIDPEDGKKYRKP